MSTLDFIRDRMSYGQSWGLNRDPGSKHSCFLLFPGQGGKISVLLEIDQVSCLPPTGLQAALWFQLVPSCPCILPSSPLTCLPHSPPRLEGIRTKRDSGTPPSIWITVNVSLFLSGKDTKTPVVEWIAFVKPFYLIWQFVFLSSTVDSVKLSFTVLSSAFFFFFFGSLVYGYESLWGKNSFFIPTSAIIHLLYSE